jgi:hypothetical protein
VGWFSTLSFLMNPIKHFVEYLYRLCWPTPALQIAAVPARPTSFLHVFSGELFHLLLVQVTVMCLHDTDRPLLQNMLLVCKAMYAMKPEVFKVIRNTMCSLLRMDDFAVRCATRNLDDMPTMHGWVNLYETYRTVRSQRYNPVMGAAISSNSPSPSTRLIPGGVDRELYDESLDHVLTNPRAIALRRVRTMLNFSLTGQIAYLNLLIVFGVFSTLENRQDAAQIIEFVQEAVDLRYDSERCRRLLHLLRNSFWIDDVSDISPNVSGSSSLLEVLPQEFGLQLTYNPADLQALNSSTSDEDMRLFVYVPPPSAST